MKISPSNLRLICLIFICASLSSCVSRYLILEFSPRSNTTYWQNGREFQIVSEDSIQINISYEENIWDTLIFNLTIINIGKRPYFIEPDKIKIINSAYTKTDSAKTKSYFAYDPELEVRKIKKEVAQNKADAINDETKSLIESTIRLTEDIVDINKEYSEEEIADKNKRHDALIDKAKIRERQNLGEKKELKNQLQNLYTTRLRKTTLFKNTMISGFVKLRTINDVDAVKIMIPVYEKEIEFAFNLKHKE